MLFVDIHVCWAFFFLSLFKKCLKYRYKLTFSQRLLAYFYSILAPFWPKASTKSNEYCDWILRMDQLNQCVKNWLTIYIQTQKWSTATDHLSVCLAWLSCMYVITLFPASILWKYIDVALALQPIEFHTNSSIQAQYMQSNCTPLVR